MPDTHNNPLSQGVSEAPSLPVTGPTMVLGVAMPDAAEIPTLSAPLSPTEQSEHIAMKEHALSVLQDGWQFRGKALIKGACSISGSFEGHLKPLLGQSASIVITGTGVVQADLHVSHASVMGLYAGSLNAPGGRVELHPGAIVSGHIRYGRLLVNDADLNATLERVIASTPAI
jgi:cytoskeletal protein CcmA (bactofilin family)